MAFFLEIFFMKIYYGYYTYILFSLLFFNSYTLQASEEDISVILFYNQSRINTSTTSTYTYNSGSSSSAFGGETGNYAGSGYGLLYEKPLKNQWNLETGLAYFSRGYSIKDSYSTDQTTFQWHSIYLPLVGRFRPTKIFTGFIGGYASYAVGAVTVSSKYSYISSEQKSTSDFKTLGFKPFEGGLTYGAGVNLHLSGSTTMIIEVRLNEGMTNIIDPKVNEQMNNGNSNVSTEAKAYMRETWLVVGFLI
jgi:hypothetical protein